LCQFSAIDRFFDVVGNFTVPKSIAAIVTVMKPWQTFTQD
jgi:hypothetical protein